MNKILISLNSFAKLLIVFCLSAWMPMAMAAITIDGSASDWTEQDRLDTPPGTPVTGYKLYGRYESNAYKILLQSDTRSIGAGTTIWLNTDQNAATGYQIFGNTGGAEFNINFFTDGKPYLYTGADGQNYVGGPLTYAVKANGSGSVMEVEIPEGQIGTPSAGVNLFVDVNNADFLPAAYTATNQYVLSKQSLPAPNSATERRIGIVYSQTTATRFWDLKNYAQLFMSAQAQAMMAGIPFDLLNENDLTDLNKIIKYDALVFPYFAYVPDATAATIERNLGLAVFKYNIGLVVGGDFMTNKADGSSMDGDSYARMKNLLGLVRADGAGPVNLELKVANTTHGAMKEGAYTSGEVVLTYSNAYTSAFGAAGSYTVTPLVTQTINNATRNAVVASVTGGRNVHFGTVGFFADANLLWSALRWSVYGDTPLAGIQLGRHNAVFTSRNDMDQSMFVDEVPTVDAPLLTKFLQPWKTKYNFVGSYYINVGNNQANGEYTNWAVSAPLYKNYMAIGNEIGTHSYTHPHDTNILSADQLKFEFADSRSIIERNLGITNIGGAVPGAPENLATSQSIIQHVNYLTGGYASVGAGFPNAIGYLTPSDTKVYMSPNMSFDFTLIEFKKMTAAQAQAQWATEFDSLNKHAKQAIIHWPWHDYGPLNSGNVGYTSTMFESLISKASTFGSEFITGDDLRSRIESFRKSVLDVTAVDASTTKVNLTSADAGRFAIDVPQATGGKKIKSVDGWYAYNDTKVFSDKDGGTFNVRLGTTTDSVTRITQLPMRANLLSLTGTGTDLNFTIEGEGKMVVKTKCLLKPTVTGGATITSFASQTLTLTLPTRKSYTINVDCVL